MVLITLNTLPRDTMVTGLEQNFTCAGYTYEPTTKDIVKATVISFVSIGIICGNIISVIVFNSQTGRRAFLKKVRLTMNSLICTDLSMGLFMCPFCVYSALYHCWPFGISFCKIEALVLSALFHESTLSLVLIALDRYFSVHHYLRYNSFMTSRKYIVAIVSTWVLVFSTYAIFIFVGGQFYFDAIGINCEPYYENRNVTITVIVLFYFFPMVLFVFSYGSIFYTANRKSKIRLSLGHTSSSTGETRHGHNAVSQVLKTSKYLAAISTGFLVAVTPWTICTLIISVTNIKLHEDLDFGVTWLAISNSFWNVVIYSVLNRKFRQSAGSIIIHQKERFFNLKTSRARLADFDLLDHCHRHTDSPNRHSANTDRTRTIYSGSTFTLSSLDTPPTYKKKLTERNYAVTSVLP